MKPTCLLAAIIFLNPLGLLANPKARDLNPVQLHDAPAHPPITLVENGKSTAAVVIHPGVTNDLAPLVKELEEVFRLTTGAELPVISVKAAEEHQGVLIHLGNWAGAASAGLDGSKLPIEGFTIKTTANGIFIVGHDDNAVGGIHGVTSSGTAWGVSEFMERFLGVRWYWTTELGGRSTIEQKTIKIDPVHLTDAPHFRKRLYFPPFSPMKGYETQDFGGLLRTLRGASSWPIQLAVHTPRSWDKNENYVKNRPEIFQLNQDGSRNFQMLDYAHPMTVQTYLEEIEDHVRNGNEKDFIVGKTVTVSPADFAVNSYSKEARALWDEDGGRYGQASRIMADFVKKLGEAMLVRFPQMNILYLPYMNYTLAPDGYKFPGNAYVELCGMPGIAQYKEPAILEAEQRNIDRWIEITGHPITDWHYSCWPADRTHAPFNYPNVLQTFYRNNRDKTKGTFINGDNHSEWLRFHTSLYHWMKLLWDPDFNVETSLDEFAKRMFGPASDTVRAIMDLQIKGWEESRWPNAILTSQAIYRDSYPRETLEKFKDLFAKAHEQLKGDAMALARLKYMEAPFEDFYKEFARVVDGKGKQEMIAKKVIENPVVDGKLDDSVWNDAPTALLRVRKDDKEADAAFPTTVKAVWTMDGVTFGFHMVEPDVKNLKRNSSGRDHALTWHDDSIELYLDVAASNDGEFVQAVVNANGAVQDLKTGDETFHLKGIKTGTHLGDGFWGMEVYVPFKDLEFEKLSSGGQRWGVQVTRHRANSKAKSVAGAENQKLNAGSGGFNNNLSDFSTLTFQE